MSISDKFRTWAEMDTEDDFIQYLERLVSGDPALAENSTASNRTPGINRPLARLAHNTDALLDALIASETKVLVTDNELTGNIEFSSGVLTFTGIWKILEIAPIEDNVGLSIADGTTVTLGADNVVYAVLDRTGGTGTVAVTLQIAGGFMDLQNTMATATDKLDYIFIGYSTGGSGSKNVFRLFNGVSIQDGEQHSGLGVDSYYGAASIQRANSGNSATIQGSAIATWSNTGNGVLEWTAPLQFWVPGVQQHKISTGSHSFSATAKFLYFELDRDASGVVTIAPADLIEAGPADIDLDGHDAVDLILVGKVNNDGDSFVFSNGRTLVEGSTVGIGNPPVDTLSFTNGAGSTTDTIGNVTLSVSGDDGLDLTTTSTFDGEHETEISMTPLWHDRFLPFLMSSPAGDVAPTRVVFDALNPDGHVFLHTSAGNGELEFKVPGYDSTTFKLRLDGNPSYEGLQLGDEELAWVILPDRGYSGGTYTFYVSGSTAPTPSDSNDEIRTGAISAFPESNPNAYIIAYKYESSPGSTEMYHFLGVQGLRDKAQWPIFRGEAYRAILSNRNVTFSTDRDFILEFAWDGVSGHYVRTLGVDRSIRVYRPGWEYRIEIDSGSDSTALWTSGGATDAVHVYFTWDEIDLASGHKSLTTLESASDHDFTLDDNQIYVGTFAYNGGTTNSMFIMWDGTILHLDGEDTRRYYASSSRLEPAVQDGLEAAMDGGSHEPSSSNKFITKGESDATTSALESRVATVETDLDAAEVDIDEIEETLNSTPTLFETSSGSTKAIGGLLGGYLPFLGFASRAGHNNPRPTSNNVSYRLRSPTDSSSPSSSNAAFNVWTIISGFDRIMTETASNASSTNPYHGEHAMDSTIVINGGIGIFGNTYVFAHTGVSIDVDDHRNWIGGDNSGANTHGIIDDGDGYGECPVSLAESAKYGTQPFLYSSGGGSPTMFWGGHHWELRNQQVSTSVMYAKAQNALFGRNYIYIRPIDGNDQTSSDYNWEFGDGTSTDKMYFSNGIEAKISRHPPGYDIAATDSSGLPDSGGNDNINLGIRKFGSSYGDDEGWWMCIGSCYLVYDSVHAMTTMDGGDCETFGPVADWANALPPPSIREPRVSTSSEGGGSAGSDGSGFSQSNVKVIPFTNNGGDVRLLLPLRINASLPLTLDPDDAYKGGVAPANPLNSDSVSWVAASPIGHGITGSESVNDWPAPNTGIDMGSDEQKQNGVANQNGAQLDLKPLLPQLDISSVTFRICQELNKVAGGSNGEVFELAIRPAIDSDVHSALSTSDGDFTTEFLREHTWAWGENEQGVNIEFDWPTTSNFYTPVFKTKCQNSGQVIFTPNQSDTHVTRAYGVWITGYKEKCNMVPNWSNASITKTLNISRLSQLEDTDV